jgi:isopentenyl diphosphate isomerase/L-lactate dehydrogenase-like FMN-dependent dehydrogenase
MLDEIPFTTQPDPVPSSKWASYMLQLYAERKPPLLGTVVFTELEEKAEKVLQYHKDAFMYVRGSAGTNSTNEANLKAFRNWSIVPHMLVNSTIRSLETTLFGVKYPSPLLMAPIGIEGIIHADAELACARAAKTVGVPFIMSTAATRSIEEVAEANGDGHRWYQLYWPRTEAITLSILRRIKTNGFTALVVTLDTMILGWRPHDLETAYLPFLQGVGIQVGVSDPVFMKRFGLQPVQGKEAHPKFPYDPKEEEAKFLQGDEEAKKNDMLGKAWLGECNSGMFRTWEDIKFLRDNWNGPLVLKGIQTVADAEKSIEVGVDGIIVSNHGGRQLDGAIPSLYALDKICQSPTILSAQKSGKLTVLFDSGIRTGSDIVKALALGAQGVLLGRPYMYGLAIGGEKGVEEVLRSLLADLDVTLGLSGFKNLQEIQGKREEVITKVDW